MAKASGFTITVGKMDSKQKALTPKGEFGRDYNNLRQSVIDLYPDLSNIMPPEVKIYEAGSGLYYSETSYGELATYCEQIYQMLSEF